MIGRNSLARSAAPRWPHSPLRRRQCRLGPAAARVLGLPSQGGRGCSYISTESSVHNRHSAGRRAHCERNRRVLCLAPIDMRTFSTSRTRSSASSRSSVSEGSVYGSFPHFSEVVKVRQEIADAVLSHAFRAAMHGARWAPLLMFALLFSRPWHRRKETLTQYAGSVAPQCRIRSPRWRSQCRRTRPMVPSTTRRSPRALSGRLTAGCRRQQSKWRRTRRGSSGRGWCSRTASASSSPLAVTLGGRTTPGRFA